VNGQWLVVNELPRAKPSDRTTSATCLSLTIDHCLFLDPQTVRPDDLGNLPLIDHDHRLFLDPQTVRPVDFASRVSLTIGH
jgi:hypothetical protein